MLLADYESYIKAQEKVDQLYNVILQNLIILISNNTFL